MSSSIVPDPASPCTTITIAPTTTARKPRAPQRFDRQRSSDGKSTLARELAEREHGAQAIVGKQVAHINHRKWDDRPENLALLDVRCHMHLDLWQKVYAHRHWRWVRATFGPEQNEPQYWTRRALVDALVLVDLDARRAAVLTVDALEERGPMPPDAHTATLDALADAVMCAGGVPVAPVSACPHVALATP